MPARHGLAARSRTPQDQAVRGGRARPRARELVRCHHAGGRAYPPFADVVERLPVAVRGRTLATINCGTGWGVAVAAPIAIIAGDAWRAAYLAFAVCAALSTLHVARTLPSRAAIPAPAAAK